MFENRHVLDVKKDELERLVLQMTEMTTDADLIEDGSRVLWIVHTIERISDRTTNIAEQDIYAVTAHEEKIN